MSLKTNLDIYTSPDSNPPDAAFVYLSQRSQYAEDVSNSDEGSSDASSAVDIHAKEKTLNVYRSPLTIKKNLDHYKLLQRWEGKVVSVDEKDFTALIKDLTVRSNPMEEVVLSKEELSPDDVSLLTLGSVFYWSIRYADAPGRGRARESLIRVRRLPGFRKGEINEAKERAKYLASVFNPNTD